MEYDLKEIVGKVSKWSEVRTEAGWSAHGFPSRKTIEYANDIDLLEKIFSTKNSVTVVYTACQAVIDLKTGRHDRELLNPDWLNGIDAEELTDEQIEELICKGTKFKIRLSEYREMKIELLEKFINFYEPFAGLCID